MHRNSVKTVVLLGLTSAVVVVVASRFGTGWLWTALGATGVSGVVVYVRADRLALRSMRAYAVSEAERPVLHRVAREVSARARVPMPRIVVSPTAAANAFATGRSPAHASMCCTEGLLELLDERELRAVVAHELAHVRSRDALLSSVAGALAAVVMFLATLSFLLPGDLPGDDDDGPGLVSTVLLLVLGPVAAGMIAMAIRRSREFDADAEAIRITGDPLGLSRALRAIDAHARRLVLPAERRIVAIGHLMIASPLQRTGLARLFRSHPPMAERIARLEQLAGYRR